MSSNLELALHAILVELIPKRAAREMSEQTSRCFTERMHEATSITLSFARNFESVEFDGASTFLFLFLSLPSVILIPVLL